MSKRYVCGYAYCLKSQLKVDNFAMQSDKQGGPREVEIGSLSNFCSNSAWDCLIQMTDDKVIVFKESSNARHLANTPRSIFSVEDHCIFVVDEQGILQIWNSLNRFLEKPKKSDSIIKSNDENGFRKILCSDLTNVALSEDNQLFQLCQDKCQWNLKLLPSLHLKSKIKEICCGKEHFLLLTSLGMVFSFGLGSRGQLGHGDTESLDSPKLIAALHGIQVTSLACGGWHSAAISECRDIYTWGWNESGQVGNSPDAESNLFQAEPFLLEFPSDNSFKKVSCGSRHSVALSDNDEVWTWGWNHYGQLCLGDRKNRSKPALVSKIPNEVVVDIHCSGWMTFMETVPRT